MLTSSKVSYLFFTLVLTIWSWSLLQFTFVLTSSKVRYLFITLVLTIWSWSLLQFTFVLTSSKVSYLFITAVFTIWSCSSLQFTFVLTSSKVSYLFIIAIFTIWPWSLLQFTFVLTSSKVSYLFFILVIHTSGPGPFNNSPLPSLYLVIPHYLALVSPSVLLNPHLIHEDFSVPLLSSPSNRAFCYNTPLCQPHPIVVFPHH